MKRLIFSITLFICVLATKAEVKIIPLPCGEAVMMIATPSPGYKFDSWTDGNTENPRIVSVEQDTIFGAIWRECPIERTSISKTIYQGDSYWFADQELTMRGIYMDTLTNMEGCDSIVQLRLSVAKKPIEYAVYLNVNNVVQGSVSGEGLYAKGSQAIITAIPTNGYQFRQWQNEFGAIVKENPYSFSVTQDVLWTAVFTRAPKRITIQSLNAPKRESDIPLCRVYTAHKYIYIENETEDDFALYDTAGRLIITQRSDYQGNLPAGVYIIRLADEVERFLIQ